jgi:hypothetical protein
MRKIKKNRYVLALFISIILFVMGFLLGLALSEYKIEYIKGMYEEQSADYESLQFQYVYLENLENLNKTEDCKTIEAVLENNLKFLGPAQEKIEAYETTGDINNMDYRIIKRKYIIANLRYWLLAEKSKDLCGSDLVSILYFYSQECAICKDQGYILSQLKNIFGDKLLIFPLDTSIKEEPIINILRRRYQISEFPTLVIENKVISKFLTKNEILKEICPIYKQNYSECSKLNE